LRKNGENGVEATLAYHHHHHYYYFTVFFSIIVIISTINIFTLIQLCLNKQFSYLF